MTWSLGACEWMKKFLPSTCSNSSSPGNIRRCCVESGNFLRKLITPHKIEISHAIAEILRLIQMKLIAPFWLMSQGHASGSIQRLVFTKQVAAGAGNPELRKQLTKWDENRCGHLEEAYA